MYFRKREIMEAWQEELTTSRKSERKPKTFWFSQEWVKPATIVKLLGKGSGLKGFILVCTFPILMGGSLFTVFPLLKTLKDKGARTGAIASFITAWGGKAPLLPLETKFLGWPFALVRLGFIIIFAFIMGILMDWVGEKAA